MEQPASGLRRRSDGSAIECLFFPVRERNEQERLEALMKRSAEQGLSLDRPKRWTWGGHTPTAGQDVDLLSVAASSSSHTLDSPIRKWLPTSPTPIDCTEEKAPPSPHRSPYRVPLGRVDQGRSSIASQGLSEESVGPDVAPEMPQSDVPAETGSAVSPVSTVSARRAESPATPTRGSSPHGQSRPRRVRSSSFRAQSPCGTGQYPPSPMRHRATTPGANGNKKWGEEEKSHRDLRSPSVPEKRSSRTDTPERKMPKSSSRDLNMDRSAEPSPVTPTGRSLAGTHDAEEASRLLAERRRQARLQKEQEEKQRLQREEEERIRAEEQRRREAEESARREEEARKAEEEREWQEQERRCREEEERQQRERRWIELQAQLDREREMRLLREVDVHYPDSEQLKIREDQERLQRKKRIEEIMKRTRRGDADAKKDATQVEPSSPISLLNSLPSPILRSHASVLLNGSLGGQSAWMVPKTVSSPSLSVGPHVSLEPLDMHHSGGDECPDEVQSMDVSPVSKEDHHSMTEFSPVDEIHPIGTNNSEVIEDQQGLTGHKHYPKLSPGHDLGDCNKNLIQGFSEHLVTRMLDLAEGMGRWRRQHHQREKSIV
ncbi:hypothetical protein GJAV_G00084850 [Gymnothorax javanicus]|nr:hypothetical protein GJAV_G00084850 [Gymnothorax javanicus]